MRLLLTSSPGASGVKLRPGRRLLAQELQHPRSGQRPLHLLTCARPAGVSSPGQHNCRPPSSSLSPRSGSCPCQLLTPLLIHNKSYSSGAQRQAVSSREQREQGRMGFLWTGSWILVLVLNSGPIQAFPKPEGSQGKWTFLYFLSVFHLAQQRQSLVWPMSSKSPCLVILIRSYLCIMTESFWL